MRAKLNTIADELCPNELRVLVMLAERLRAGQDAYGALDPRGDAREWRRETMNEVLDAQVYCACELMRLA